VSPRVRVLGRWEAWRFLRAMRRQDRRLAPATAVCRRRGHLWRAFAGGPWARSWYCVRCETISRTGDGYWPADPAEVATTWAELKRGQQ